MRTLDLDPIVAAEAEGEESFKFRIEVLRDLSEPTSFRARVCRWETQRLAPTFPSPPEGAAREEWDKEVLVIDEGQDWDAIRGTTAEQVLAAVLDRLDEIFETPVD